jgi:hypothetical protein
MQRVVPAAAGVPVTRVCPIGEPKEAMADRGPDGRLVLLRGETPTLHIRDDREPETIANAAHPHAQPHVRRTLDAKLVERWREV